MRALRSFYASPLTPRAVDMFAFCSERAAVNSHTLKLLERAHVHVHRVASHGRKDAADHALMAKMTEYALDHRASDGVDIVLVSGDVDFAPLLKTLRARHYRTCLVIPDHIYSRPELLAAADDVRWFSEVCGGEPGALVMRALRELGDEHGMTRPRLTQVVTQLRRRRPDLPVASASALVEECEQLGLLRIHRHDHMRIELVHTEDVASSSDSSFVADGDDSEYDEYSDEASGEDDPARRRVLTTLREVMMRDKTRRGYSFKQLCDVYRKATGHLLAQDLDVPNGGAKGFAEIVNNGDYGDLLVSTSDFTWATAGVSVRWVLELLCSVLHSSKLHRQRALKHYYRHIGGDLYVDLGMSRAANSEEFLRIVRAHCDLLVVSRRGQEWRFSVAPQKSAWTPKKTAPPPIGTSPRQRGPLTPQRQAFQEHRSSSAKQSPQRRHHHRHHRPLTPQQHAVLQRVGSKRVLSSPLSPSPHHLRTRRRRSAASGAAAAASTLGAHPARPATPVRQ